MDQKRACSSNNNPQQPRTRSYAFQEPPSKQSISNDNEKRKTRDQSNQSLTHGNERRTPRTSQHDVDQESYNKCVTFAEKLCAAREDCCRMQRNASANRTSMNSSNGPNSSQNNAQKCSGHCCNCTKCAKKEAQNHNQSSGPNRSMPAHHQSLNNSTRSSMNLSSNQDSCNCLKCRTPGHTCDCAKCQSKKEAHSRSLSASRSVQLPRTEASCENDTIDFVPLLSSTQRFHSSRSMESYQPLSSTQRHHKTDQNYGQPSTLPELASTQKYHESTSIAQQSYRQPIASTQRQNTNDQHKTRTRSRSQGSCQCQFDERPTTSTRTSCNLSSMSTETRRSLMSTELNKTLFHPNSNDRLNKSNRGSIDLLCSMKDNENLLVEDTYNPGLIEDCVAGKKDFNAVSFGMFFENTQQIPKNMPEKTPMTLLEAISKRIDAERMHMSDALHCQPDSQELNVDSIDLYFSCKPETELNDALSSLFKAEVLFNEKVDCNKTNNESSDNNEVQYDIEVHQTELPLVGGCPITVESYSGTTKLKQNYQNTTQNESKKKGKK